MSSLSDKPIEERRICLLCGEVLKFGGCDCFYCGFSLVRTAYRFQGEKWKFIPDGTLFIVKEEACPDGIV